MKSKTAITVMVIGILSVAMTGCSGFTGKTKPAQTNTLETTQFMEAPLNQNPTPTTMATVVTQVTSTSAPTQAVKVKADKVLLYDIAHREIFSPLDVKNLGYAKVSDMFKNGGYEIRTNKEPLTKESLKGVDCVMIAGPMGEFTEQELSVLLEFINEGGDILITLHIAQPASPLVQLLGFQISNSPIAQSRDTFDGSPKFFVAKNVIKDPLTEGVSGVAVRASWALLPSADNARNIVGSASDAWVDIVPNDQYDIREPVASFCVVGAASIGKGRAVVIGDDAVLTNITVDMADNRKLCENVITWFEGSTR